jgi:hypothetical protein
MSVTATPKVRKPRKVTRTVRLALEPFQGNPGVLEIRITSGVRVPRTEVFEYLVFPLAADFGRAFRLDKFRDAGDEEQTSYSVNLDGPRSTCECTGFLRHGMEANGGKGCKHIAGLQTLVNFGKL